MEGHLQDCPECGTANNRMVNEDRCWKCGHEWDRGFAFAGP